MRCCRPPRCCRTRAASPSASTHCRRARCAQPKRCSARASRAAMQEAIDAEEQFWLAASAPEAKEAFSAFLQKRKPDLEVVNRDGPLRRSGRMAAPRRRRLHRTTAIRGRTAGASTVASTCRRRRRRRPCRCHVGVARRRSGRSVRRRVVELPHAVVPVARREGRADVVEHYVDAADGLLARNADGKMAMTLVTLRPRVRFAAGGAPDARRSRGCTTRRTTPASSPTRCAVKCAASR